MRPLQLLCLATALAACAGTDPAVGDDDNLAVTPRPDATMLRDLVIAPRPDLTLSSDLALGPDLSCTLGDPDHCGSCQTVCPPGKDDVGTARTCSGPGPGATCDIQCKGELYDVNGRADDGCESADTPVQDTFQTAVPITLPDKVDPQEMSNPLNLLGKLYSDGRTHRDAPAMRKNGRDDWYAVKALGQGDPNSKMGACLSISSLPPDNSFEVCISDFGKTLFDPNSCKTVGGMMSSVCVAPPAMTDAGDPYYVRVRKLAGTPSVNGYALFLKH